MTKPQYGAAHRKARAQWKRIVDAGEATCCLCGRWIEPGAAWDLDHVPHTDQYRGAACARCNRSEGATRGNRMRGGLGRWIL